MLMIMIRIKKCKPYFASPWTDRIGRVEFAFYVTAGDSFDE